MGTQHKQEINRVWGDRRAMQSPLVVDWVLRGLILLVLGGIFYFSLSSGVFQPLFRAAEKHQWVSFIVRPSVLWALMGTVMLCFRTLLWFTYRPYPAAEMDDAPPITVIIPAYNEGAMVAET